MNNLTLQLSQEVSNNILTFNVKTKRQKLAFPFKNDKYFYLIFVNENFQSISDTYISVCVYIYIFNV